MFLVVLLLVDLTVLPYAYRRIRTAEFWVMRTPQTPYQQVCKHFRAPMNILSLATFYITYILLWTLLISVVKLLPTPGLEPGSAR